MKNKLFILSVAVALSLCPAMMFGQANNSRGVSGSKQSTAQKSTSGSTNKQQSTAQKSASGSTNKQQSTAQKTDNKQASAPKADTKKKESAKVDTKKQASAPKQQASAPKSVPKGYENKMKYDSKSGHWSYLRDGKWYTYDHYIEPTVYYSRPLSEFSCALIGTVVGAIISALIN